MSAASGGQRSGRSRTGGPWARLEALLSAQGDENRARELARRAGWAWLGVYRRYDEYRAAVAQALNAESRQARTASVERADAELVA